MLFSSEVLKRECPDPAEGTDQTNLQVPGPPMPRSSNPDPGVGGHCPGTHLSSQCPTAQTASKERPVLGKRVPSTRRKSRHLSSPHGHLTEVTNSYGPFFDHKNHPQFRAGAEMRSQVTTVRPFLKS